MWWTKGIDNLVEKKERTISEMAKYEKI